METINRDWLFLPVITWTMQKRDKQEISIISNRDLDTLIYLSLESLRARSWMQSQIFCVELYCKRFSTWFASPGMFGLECFGKKKIIYSLKKVQVNDISVDFIDNWLLFYFLPHKHLIFQLPLGVRFTRNAFCWNLVLNGLSEGDEYHGARPVRHFSIWMSSSRVFNKQTGINLSFWLQYNAIRCLCKCRARVSV